jgi:outer membrane protein
MKNLSAILSIVAFLGVAALFYMHFAGNKTTPAASATAPATTIVPSGKIAYIDIDSLESNYEYLKNKKEEFKNRQAQAESELERAAAKMQNDANSVQQKMQAGTLTKTEYEDAQKRLEQMQQSLMTRKQALTDQLMKEQDDFNKNLKNRLDAFLADYNKDKHYDYIFSYGNGGSILYTNKALDITKDVIAGMNAQIQNDGDKKNK